MNRGLIIALVYLIGALGILSCPEYVLSAVAEKTPLPGEEFGLKHSANYTADHAKFKELQQEFKSGPEVTKACLTCHTEAASQVHKTLHWTWKVEGAGGKKLGKAGDTVNNFCIAIGSNEPRCTSCHIGYGRKDKSFDLTAQDKVDCLACHEQTGAYKKFPTMAGNVVSEPTEFGGQSWNPPDWNKVAQSVSLPTRKNCGECHFFGGGGEGVKHGDLDASMFTPDKQLDVHMSPNGLNFSCQRCHSTEKHELAGRSYEAKAENDNRSLLENDDIKKITCYSCHSEKPHKTNLKANDHTDKVACQTCHIPAFARKNSTKMYWDWSTAGKRDEKGKPVVEKRDGRPAYDGMKGSFVWQKDVVPEYLWYNGELKYLTLKDKVDPGLGPVRINSTTGSYADSKARIYPFKLHRGKQPFDPINSAFISPHLFGKDDAAYWKGYDWKKASEVGMAYMGLPFSGEVSFIESEYLFQTTHMVAPKENALSCAECHSRNGRMQKLTGFYMPGRDKHSGLDGFGWAGVGIAFLGVTGHGMVRIVRRKKQGR
ncbi:MAG: tetrathionate reductase family octaheme c-type cytochrome [Syntrophobacteraceae bacterium]